MLLLLVEPCRRPATSEPCRRPSVLASDCQGLRVRPVNMLGQRERHVGGQGSAREGGTLSARVPLGMDRRLCLQAGNSRSRPPGLLPAVLRWRSCSTCSRAPLAHSSDQCSLQAGVCECARLHAPPGSAAPPSSSRLAHPQPLPSYTKHRELALKRSASRWPRWRPPAAAAGGRAAAAAAAAVQSAGLATGCCAWPRCC